MGFTNWINDIADKPTGEQITLAPLFPGEKERTFILQPESERFRVGRMSMRMNFGSKVECPNCKTKFNN